MASESDIAVMPIEQGWINAGIDYALCSWAVTFNRLGKKNIYSRLSKIIVGVVAEHATRKALDERGIVYDLSGATKWYAVDRYDIGVNGKSVDIKAIFVDRGNSHQVSKLSRHNAIEDLSQAVRQFTALVPEDQFNSAASKKRAGREKVYVFPVVDSNSVLGERSGRLCHLMWDYRWLKKGKFADSPKLGKLIVRSKSAGKFRLVGTSSKNELVTEIINLKLDSVETKNSFWQLFAIESLNSIPVSMSVKSERCKITEKIGPRIGFSIGASDEIPTQNDWMQVGIGPGSVLISGFATDRTLRIKGRSFPRYSKDILQYSDTLIDNWGISFEKLSPLEKLKSV